MKVDPRHQTERQGVAEVQRRVTALLGWLFREQPTSDYGIDAHIEVVENNIATGRLIGAQIKSGASYFEEPVGRGYTYRGDNDHLDYWLNHSLPVIVAIYNPDNDDCLWGLVSESRVTRTKKAWTMTVLCDDKFDASRLDALNIVSGALVAQLRQLADRVESCRQRYWRMSKDERIETGLRPDTYASGYSGNLVIEAAEEVLAKALRGRFPLESASLQAWSVLGGDRAFSDLQVVIDIITPLIAELEGKLAAAESAAG